MPRRPRSSTAQRPCVAGPTTPTTRVLSATPCCVTCSPAGVPRRTWSRRSRARGCAAWAAPASPPGRSGRWLPARRRARRTSCATPTSRSPAPSRTGRSSPTSRTSSSRACSSAWWWSAPRTAGSSSGTSTDRRRTSCGPSWRGCAARGCWATTCWAADAGCRSRCSCRPAATSSARSRRCWSAWRVTGASRATSRPSPASTGSGAGPRSSTRSRPSPTSRRSRRAARSGGRTRATGTATV